MPTSRSLQRLPLLVVIILSLAALAQGAEPPSPYGVLPSERQLAWHDMEFYGFLHFTINTFTDQEWGYGDESPQLFNPTDFSADQIVGTAKMAGMRGLILTCKHHDGFCLWPSKYTDHDIAASPFRDGQGDVVREIADACRRHGLEFGVYLSPWDRNHPDYGRPAYVEYYRNQLRELLTNYGPLFEVWWDGANGGTGYYGGARERRTIDRRTYYDWPNTINIVRQLQPMACIFSDVGPDVRWIGNEHGIAGDPCWATMNKGDMVPGISDREALNHGHRGGAHWIPGECDVSIRPGWFYHASQDEQVRSAENLVNLYYQSIGRGASLLLNLPPDRRGRIHDNDVASLEAFRQVIDKTFDENLAKQGTLSANSIRAGDARFAVDHLLDGDRATYWATDDDVPGGQLILRFDEPITFDVVDIREYLLLGQRMDSWAVDRWSDAPDAGDGQWVEFAAGQSIGNRRLWRGEPVTTQAVRLRIDGPVCPALSEFGLYREPTDGR